MTGSLPAGSAVDWSPLPAPPDDGAMRHVPGMMLPRVSLVATDGTDVMLADLPGRTVVYAYPLTGRPGVALPDGWDGIPGARGCTPQSYAFRDHYAELRAAGVAAVYGLSTQDTAYQQEAQGRLHLPFPLLSDHAGQLADAMGLPTLVVAGERLLRRFALVMDDGVVTQVFYPVFPPDQNAADVLAWVIAHPRAG